MRVGIQRDEAEDGTVTYRFVGAMFRECKVCFAPLVSPMPKDWSLEVDIRGVGAKRKVYGTPHKRACPR